MPPATLHERSNPLPSNPFADRVAVVTGGAGGIGAAIVERLASLGARVAVLDLQPTTPVAGSSVVGLHCDVRDVMAVREAFSQVETSLGAVEFLVTAVGVVSEAPVEEMEYAEWDRVIQTNLTGAFLCCQAAVRQMRPRQFGRIVNFSSGYAIKGYARGSHYAGAKAGVIALTMSLALEVAPHGINVNAIAPGPVDTPMLQHIGNSESLLKWKSRMSEIIPKGRIGQPQDMVGPTLFLLGPESEFITGQTLFVNGGLDMR